MVAIARRSILRGAASVPLATILASPNLVRAAAGETERVTITTPSGREVSGALAMPDALPAHLTRHAHAFDLRAARRTQCDPGNEGDLITCDNATTLFAHDQGVVRISRHLVKGCKIGRWIIRHLARGAKPVIGQKRNRGLVQAFEIRWRVAKLGTPVPAGAPGRRFQQEPAAVIGRDGKMPFEITAQGLPPLDRVEQRVGSEAGQVQPIKKD